MGETPKPDRYLDIEAELELVSEVKATLTAHSAAEDTSSQQLEKKAMKELGLNRYMHNTHTHKHILDTL